MSQRESFNKKSITLTALAFIISLFGSAADASYTGKYPNKKKREVPGNFFSAMFEDDRKRVSERLEKMQEILGRVSAYFPNFQIQYLSPRSEIFFKQTDQEIISDLYLKAKESDPELSREVFENYALELNKALFDAFDLAYLYKTSRNTISNHLLKEIAKTRMKSLEKIEDVEKFVGLVDKLNTYIPPVHASLSNKEGASLQPGLVIDPLIQQIHKMYGDKVITNDMFKYAAFFSLFKMEQKIAKAPRVRI